MFSSPALINFIGFKLSSLHARQVVDPIVWSKNITFWAGYWLSADSQPGCASPHNAAAAIYFTFRERSAEFVTWRPEESSWSHWKYAVTDLKNCPAIMICLFPFSTSVFLVVYLQHTYHFTAKKRFITAVKLRSSRLWTTLHSHIAMHQTTCYRFCFCTRSYGHLIFCHAYPKRFSHPSNSSRHHAELKQHPPYVAIHQLAWRTIDHQHRNLHALGGNMIAVHATRSTSADVGSVVFQCPSNAKSMLPVTPSFINICLHYYTE